MDKVEIIDWSEDLADAQGKILYLPWDFNLWHIRVEMERLKPEAVMPPHGSGAFTLRAALMVGERSSGPIIAPVTGKSRRDMSDLLGFLRQAKIRNFALPANVNNGIPIEHWFSFDDEEEWWHIAGCLEPPDITGQSRLTWSEEGL